MLVCARVCACVCVIPGGTSLPQTSMHHNASAIYKIDDQRLCRSGQNDAADIHRGTLTDNGRQGEVKQTEAIMEKQKAKKKKKKKRKRNAAAHGLMDKQNKTMERIEYGRGMGRAHSHS